MYYVFVFFVVISCFVVKDASDFDSNGRLLKVVEIDDSTWFVEECKVNLSQKQILCSASSKLAQIKSAENLEPKMQVK